MGRVASLMKYVCRATEVAWSKATLSMHTSPQCFVVSPRDKLRRNARAGQDVSLRSEISVSGFKLPWIRVTKTGTIERRGRRPPLPLADGEGVSPPQAQEEVIKR